VGRTWARIDWYSERWYKVVKGSGANASSSPLLSARCNSAVRFPNSAAESRYGPIASAMGSGGMRAIESTMLPHSGISMPEPGRYVLARS
jgi:hypothetical protein